MDCSTVYSTHLEGEGSDANVDPLTTDTDGSMRHRGPTRGLEIDEHVGRYGRIPIIIEEEDEKPTDENAQKLSSECGCIVRQFAPLQVQKWSKIPVNDRKALFPYLLNKFDIEISAPHICKFLNHNMGRRYADYRHDLHLQYRKSKSLAKAQAEFPNLSEEDWNYLCTQLFNTPEFQSPDELVL
ncbi:uncharacterized protein LOC113325351 [Papaver somniferum]|uniref:uncharacterized protein LOC113325351 n=1 Tax=Papaver somniferum TaxID=3469 RepID=UPI000E700A7A|nr:uncharacterized protein LOC113325351 [Papaver somniferum]